MKSYSTYGSSWFGVRFRNEVRRYGLQMPCVSFFFFYRTTTQRYRSETEKIYFRGPSQFCIATI